MPIAFFNLASSVAVVVVFTSCGGGSTNAPSTSPSVSVSAVSLVGYTVSNTTLNLKGMVSGLVITPLTALDIHLSSDCKDASVGHGTVSDFTLTGISAVVPTSTATLIYVKTNTDPVCYYMTKYTPTISQPAPPAFTQTIPVSPSRVVSSPRINGTTTGSISSVKFYDDSFCVHQVGTGTPFDFANAGIVLALTPDVTSDIYAVTVEPLGAKSVCSLLTRYTHNINAPPAPTLISITPSAPSRTVTTPVIVGMTDPAVVNVNLFKDSACLTQIGSGLATDFGNAAVGLTATVSANTQTSIYAQGVDQNGVTSMCGYLTLYIHDTVAPTVPTFTAITPTSPTRLTIYPVLTGTADTDTATLKFYSNPSCTIALGQGSRNSWQGAGIQISVTGNAQTDIYAQAVDLAGNASICTQITSYVNNTIPPDPPIFTSTTPPSPNNRSTTPLVIGIPSTGTVTVQLFNEGSCFNQIGTGTDVDFMSTGILATAASNATTHIYANAVDNVGNTSVCALMVDYDHSTAPAPIPVFTRTVPASPSKVSTTPLIQGTANVKISDVAFYKDALCSLQIGVSSRSTFTGSGTTVTVPANSTTSIYTVATDVYGNTSPCTYVTTYTHDNIAPTLPIFTSISPTSPNNVSTTPTIRGSASSDTTIVKFYDDDSCTSQLGSDTRANYVAGGIALDLPANTSTTIYAIAFDAATNGSACSYMTTYTHDNLKPGKPNFVTSNPLTPSYTPETLMKGTIGANTDFMPIQEIDIYTDNLCSGTLYANGTDTQFKTAGIPVTVPINAVTSFYALSLDVVGNKSICTKWVDFNHSNIGPAGMNVTAALNGSVSVAWTSDPNATSYIVKRSTKSGGPYTIIAPYVVSTSFTDSLTENNRTYYYVVSAVNLTGMSHDSGEATVTITPGTPLPPSSLTATPAVGKVQLGWTITSTQMSFSVYRATQTGGPYTQIANGLTVPNFLDSGVANETAYYYVVAASNPSGNSAFSNEASAVPKLVPSAPVTLTGHWDPVALAYVLQWTAPSYYTGFTVKRAFSPGSTSFYASVSAGTFSYSDTAPQGSSFTHYPNYYTVTATWGGLESANSNEIGFAYEGSPPLTAGPGHNEVVLSWPAQINGAASYDIMRSLTPGGPYTVVNAGNTGLAYTDSAVTDGAAYYYVIAANITPGLQAAWSAEVSAVPRPVPTTAPGNLVVTTLTNGYPQLSWSIPDKFNSFKVYRATTIGGTYTQINASPVTSNAYADTTIPGNGIYFYKITSLWGSAESAATNIVSFRFGVPLSLTATTGTSSIALSWTAVAGVSAYKIYRGTVYGTYGTTFTGTASNSYTDTTPVANQGYFYSVRAVFADGTLGQYSPVASGQTGTVKVPSALSIVTVATGSITLAWAAIPGITSYKIYKASVTGGPYTYTSVTTSATTATVSGLSNGNKYFFVVTAVTGSTENTTLSNEASAFDYAPLLAPSFSVGNNSVVVNWGTQSGATGYQLQRSTDLATWSNIGPGNTTTSYSDTGLINGTTYYYRVKVVFTGVNTLLYSAASFGATPGVVLPAPAGLGVTTNNDGVSLVLTWAAVPGATGYEIQMSSTSGSGYVDYAPSGSSFATLPGLTAGVPYYFVVYALNGSLASAISPEISVTPLITPPAPTALVVNNNSIVVNWSPVSCNGTPASKYNLLRSTDFLNYLPYVAAIAAVTYTDTSYTDGVSYSYEIVPVCGTNVIGATSARSSPQVTPGVPPLVPVNLYAAAQTSSQIGLSWVPTPIATYYNVYRTTTSGSGYIQIATHVVSANYADAGLSSGRYYYAVSSVNQSGVESAKSAEATAALTLTAPASTAALTAGNSITISWSAVAGATSYDVLRSISAGGPYGVIASGQAGLSYSDTNLVVGTTYYYVITARGAGGVASEYSPEANATASTSVNLQVAIEMTDGAMSSFPSPIIFQRTQTTIDTAAYDGTVTYRLEVDATNTDSVPAVVSIVDSSGMVIGNVSVPGSTSTIRRLSASVVPNSGWDVYRIQLGGTTTAGLLSVYAARVTVKQVGATKTKIYIPLLSSEMNPTAADDNAPIETSQSTSYAALAHASYYARNALALSQLNDYNAWEFEAVVNTTGTTTVGAVSLLNSSTATKIDDTESYFNVSNLSLINAQFDEGVNGFGTGDEGDIVQPQLRCVAYCASGTVSLYKAGMWVTLINLTKAEIYLRSMQATIGVNSLVTPISERTRMDMTVYSNPTTYFQALASLPSGGSATVSIGTAGASDTATAGFSSVSNSVLSFSGSAKSLVRTGTSITPTQNDRWAPIIDGSSGTVNVYDATVVVDVHN